MTEKDTSAPAFEVLFEAPDLPAFDLPPELAAIYGGSLGFDGPRLFANFVATLDGVVSIPSLPRSNRLIAAGSSADRFLMGLLRASADVIMIGSRTMAASPRSIWSPEQAFPDAAAGYAELRRRAGLEPDLDVAVVSASGLLDPLHPVLQAGALVLTTAEGAGRLAGKLPDENLVPLGPEGPIDPARIVRTLRDRGHRLILSEGGPHAIGRLLEAGVVDELFLTVSPLLVGRTVADPRFALVEGADLLQSGAVGARLLGVRREVDHLFLRYALGRQGQPQT
ncbi:MAG TPA: dihydrofolate reductase family protein [Gaiellaceae bacterium]|nr:dihydrofolate reductase family protein [Gaiellaceae bacterium]